MSSGLFTNMLLREIGADISRENIDRPRRLHAEAYQRNAADVRRRPARANYLATSRRRAFPMQSPPAAAWKPQAPTSRHSASIPRGCPW
jgi:hypothetical protein